jgi:hypothetical protein
METADHQPVDISSLKRLASLAIEMVPNINLKSKIAIADQLFEMGKRLSAESNSLKDCIYFFRTVIDVLDAPHDRSLDNEEVNQKEKMETFRSQIMALKINSYLALSFIFCETE